MAAKRLMDVSDRTATSSKIAQFRCELAVGEQPTEPDSAAVEAAVTAITSDPWTVSFGDEHLLLSIIVNTIPDGMRPSEQIIALYHDFFAELKKNSAYNVV